MFGENLLPPRITLILLSSLCCVLIALTGRMYFNARAGILGAFIWAIYPTAILSWYSSDRLLTEGLGIFFLLASFYFLAKLFRQYSLKGIIMSSLLLGLAILTRGYLALILPLVVGFIFFFGHEKRFKTAFLYGLITTFVLGIWVARNYFVMGKAILSTQTDSFYWGNNEYARGSMYGDVFTLEPWTAPQVQKLVQKYPGIKDYSEVQLSEVWMREGFGYLKEHPKRALWLFGRKTAIYLLPTQFWSVGIYKINYFYLLLLPVTFFVFWRVKNKKEYFLILLPFIGVWISSLLTFSIDRYRFTVEPFIIIIGSFGLLEFISVIKLKFLSAKEKNDLK
ncbi:MAG: ArnT family glycosyltransferase [Chitinophagaceae bacterium]